jgi:hypothetical protein
MFCHPFLAVLRPSAKDAKMDINLFHYFPPDTQVLTRLDAIEQKLDRVLKVEQRMENTMALDFTKMIAATTAQTTVTNSVLQTLTDLAAKITDLSAQLAAAIAANDPVAQAAVQTQLDALAQGITDNDDKIAAAIVAPGTPGTPPPVTP